MANNTRSVLVVGLGRFGSSVATTLDTMGQDVLAVDKDGELVNVALPNGRTKVIKVIKVTR